MNQYAMRPSIFSRFSDIPLPLLLCFYLIQNCYIMRPRNLCRHCLHKFPVRIGRRKFRHVFEISHRIPFCFRESQPNVCSKVLNKFISPGFMLVNGCPDVVVQAYQFPVDIQRCLYCALWISCLILCTKSKYSPLFISICKSPILMKRNTPFSLGILPYSAK